jgi:predicted metal-dependent phosphoesterase TrpH
MTDFTDYRVGVIHMHSIYSHDGKDALESMHEDCVARGIQFVGMTDHAEDFTPDLFEEYVKHCDAVSNEQVTFIPGLEFRFAGLKGMHLLALGLRSWIEPKTPDEFIELARRAARFTVLAHPVYAKYKIPQVVLDYIDAIEVWNGNYNTRWLPDPRSIDMVHAVRQRRPHVVATVGLDQHDSSNDRELRLLVNARANDPLGELRAGRFINVGRTMHFDSAAVVPPMRLRGLRVARKVLDTTDRTHDRVVKFFRRLGSVKPRV